MTARSNHPLVSIVVPVLNEQENIESLYRTVNEVMASIRGSYDYEFVFTDNHSTDRSFQVLEVLAKSDRRVRAIRFSKNFGYQRSIWTAYSHARGNVAIQLDCDLQDPPSLIPEFLRLWEQGYKVVYGVRKSRASEAFWMQWARKLFYRLIDYLSEDRLPHDAGDFRLVDRCILDELKRLDDPRPYLRGAIARMGFNQIGVPYDRKDRTKGSSKFKFRQLIGLAADGILNHSIVPLRLASYTGIVVALITIAGMAIVVIGKSILHKNWPAGFATTTILILIGVSLNALFLGIIGEYLGRIYQQVKRHPVTIIEAVVPSDENDRQ